MAGDWLKMEANTPDKPEVFEIAAQLGITTAEAFGRLFLVWRFFDQHTEDGNGVNVSTPYLDHIAGVTGFASAMKGVHWLEGEEADGYGLKLPNFDRHNGKTAKSRALTAKRVATHKQRSGNAPLTQSALPREEKRREEVKTKEEVAMRLPEWLPLEAWNAYLEVRKKLKAPNTPRPLGMLITELTRLKSLGFDPCAVLDQSSLKGWKSVYALKAEVVALMAEPKGKLCDYCARVSTGAVNGRRACGEHWPRAMDNEVPAKIAA